MTNLNDDEYARALNIVAKKELSLLETTADVVAKATSALQEAQDELQEIFEGLPTVNGIQSVPRVNVENAYNQIRSFRTQIQYLIDTFASLKSQFRENFEDLA